MSMATDVFSAAFEGGKNNCDAHDDNSSVDTNDAFMHMLGFSDEGPESLDVEERIESPNSSTTVKATACSCKPIQLPVKCSRYQIEPSECLALVLEDVLTESQCQCIVQMAGEDFRYITEATHKSPDGTSFTVEIQNPNPHKLSAIDTNHDPLMLTSSSKVSDGTLLMDHLYNKIAASIESHPRFQSFEKRTKCGSMQGLNPRMRVLRYDAKDNDRFDAHFDATTYVPGISNQRRSLITVLVYLNNGDGVDFEGGETFYFQHSKPGEAIKYEGAAKVVPKTGSVVVFEHDLFHSGAVVTNGTKYIMRTDILFEENGTCKEKVTGILDYEEDLSLNNSGILVSKLCNELNFTEDTIGVLRGMDLLDISCESLLAPGTTILKSILLDCGLREDAVELFINGAQRVVEKNK